MSIRRSHRNGNQGATNKSRIARIRDKALRMQARIKQATMSMLERRTGYVSWWQRAFRVPTVGFFTWCRTRATSMVAALMMMLGLKPRASEASRAKAHSRSYRKTYLRGLMLAEGLEQRQLMAGFVVNGTNLDITLDGNENVAITAGIAEYTIVLTGGNWAGADDSTLSGSGTTTLTIDENIFTTINIEDTSGGNSVTFNHSTHNYLDNFSVVLDEPSAGAISFNGTTSFIDANALSVSTKRNVLVTSSAIVSVVDGNLTLVANGDGTSATDFSGIRVNNAQVKSTGSGNVTLNGTGGGDEPFNAGVKVDGGLVTSGTGNVSVTGTGSQVGGLQLGVHVFPSGTISAGASGTVTVIGYGGGGQSVTDSSNNYGVAVVGSSSKITSSGGSVSVTGTGGGKAGAGNSNQGVFLGGTGEISSGGTGTVTVIGNGGTGTDGSHAGIAIENGAKVTSSGGGVSVTGNAGTVSAGNVNNIGVWLRGTGAQIGAGGSGNVTVVGTGGANASSTLNHGILVGFTGYAGAASIVSAGGNVSLTGTAGGGTDPLGVRIEDSKGSVSTVGGGNITINSNTLHVGGGDQRANENGDPTTDQFRQQSQIRFVRYRLQRARLDYQ